ncbi:MAG: HAMP domain-containing sensor histidine kinase [Lachnospiraceae bacterium]|nr:HAMP domain-containing sensor histidine kinase [Lachnospiraceae bacterium]
MKNNFNLKDFFNSFRVRIAVLVLLVGVVPCTVFVVSFSSLYEKQAVNSDVTDLVSKGQVLNKQIISSGYLNQRDSELVDNQLEVLSGNLSGRIMVIDNTLTIIKDTYNADEGKTIIWGNVVSTFQNKTTSVYDDDNDYLVVTVPIKADGDDDVQGVLVMNKTMSYIDTNLEYFQSLSIILCLILYILMLVLALFSSDYFTKPFRKFCSVIEDVENGVSQDVVVVDDFTETADVSNRMNSLLNRMRVVDESRQEFVSNVSHELKTPLTSMKVLADSLNGQEDVPVELYREFMQDIGEEIERETKIINDLLSMVKMDKAAATLNIAPVNMNELIELILKRLKPIAEKQHVELVFESFRPVTAEIDEVKFTLAITNLVENGIKYNQEGGWVHVSLNSDHQYCYIKVEDSGMGIPEDSLDHIFERFYRVDKSHSREIGGTGLGLAITKSAISMHKGDIKVHSVEGEGTMFDVRLPLNYIAKEVR